MFRETLFIATAAVLVTSGSAMPVGSTTGKWVNACLTRFRIKEPTTAMLHGTTQEVTLVPSLEHKQLFELGYCISTSPVVGFDASGSTCQTTTQRHRALVYIKASETESRDYCRAIPESDWLECWKWVDLPGPCQMMVMKGN